MGEYVNSHQLQSSKSPVSCGVLEIHHLPNQSPAKTVFALATMLYHKANPRPTAFVMFSDVVRTKEEAPSRGSALASFMQQNAGLINCGSMWCSPVEVNPKTGNLIQVYFYHLNHEAFREWYKEELANALTED